MQRLDVGAATFVSLRGETRPAVKLRTGETRAVSATVPAGARLVVAFGGGRYPGMLQLRISADGKPVSLLAVPSDGYWRTRTVELPVQGTVRLEFEGQFARGRRARSPGPTADEAWIALAVPRLYAPRTAPGRVLVWISQDTLRADHLSTYGYGRPTSPFLDELSKGATVFESAMSPAPWTLPALASQLTSRYPSFHGAMLHDLATADPTLFESLAGAGFTVLSVTGNPLLSSRNGLARGMDLLAYDRRRADVLGNRLVTALDEWGGGDLALFLHLMEPHLPYTPPPPWDTEFVDPSYHGPVRGPSDFPDAFPTIDEAGRRNLMALYDGEIRSADEEIRALFATLRERGLLDRAVIAYTSDHGEEFREHGSWRHGHSVFQELVHVPFVLKTPGAPARRVSRLVSLVDLAPTLLESLGLPAPPSFQGRSLVPFLRGGELPEAPAYSETILTPLHDHVFAVQIGSRKYVARGPRGGDLEHPTSEQLFDLAADPGEQHSLSLDEAERARSLRKAYFSRAAVEGHAPIPITLDAESIERLKAWGYIQ